MNNLKSNPKNFTSLFLLFFTSTVWSENITIPPKGRELHKALSNAGMGDTITLKSGRYRGSFTLPIGVTLIAEKKYKAILDGDGRTRTLTMRRASEISGLSITDGHVGLYISGADAKVQECRIYKNRHTGVMIIASIDDFSNNLIYRNGGSGVQVWSYSDKINVNVFIKRNTIANNMNHGLAISGAAFVDIENTIIAFNYGLTIESDGKGRVAQNYNVYYANLEFNSLLPENNFSFDPQFINRITGNYNLENSSHCINNGINGTTIGALYEQ